MALAAVTRLHLSKNKIMCCNMDDTATYIFVDIIEKSRPVIFTGYCVIGSVHSKVAQIMGTCDNSLSFI